MLILWVSLFLSGNTVSSITVVREGLFGSVSVNVARGFLAGTFPAGFTAGQVLISGSPLSFTGSMKNATFSAVVSFPCIIQLTMTTGGMRPACWCLAYLIRWFQILIVPGWSSACSG